MTMMYSLLMLWQAATVAAVVASVAITAAVLRRLLRATQSR